MPTTSKNYDLTSRCSSYLDVHFLSSILDFLSTTSLYPASTISKQRESLNTILCKKSQVIVKDASTLKDSLKYAKDLYENGEYRPSQVVLEKVLETHGLPVSGAFGKLATEIQLQEWEKAVQSMYLVDECIEKNETNSALTQLQQRTWLLHWSLLILKNDPTAHEKIVDFMMTPRCLETMQTNAPWLLRYVTIGVMSHTRRISMMPEVVEMVEMEKEVYSDPILAYVDVLSTSFDFDCAVSLLKDVEVVIQQDYFLQGTVGVSFMEAARILLLETYVRINQQVKISTMAVKLGMEEKATAMWIQMMKAKEMMDEKITVKDNMIVMKNTTNTAYQQVMEKTKELDERTASMEAQLERILQESN